MPAVASRGDLWTPRPDIGGCASPHLPRHGRLTHCRACDDALVGRVDIRSGTPQPQAVERILRELPEWFGIESSIREYAEAPARLRNYVAISGDDETDPVGVLLLDRHFDEAAEIHLLAVTPTRHRIGIGSALVEAAEADLVRDGVRFLQVKTLGPSHKDPHYDATRAFYLRRGFCPLEEIHGLWPGNPCLVMVKSLTP